MNIPDYLSRASARRCRSQRAVGIRRPWLYNWREPSAVEMLPLELFDDEGDCTEA